MAMMPMTGTAALVVVINDEQRPARRILLACLLLTSQPTPSLMIASGLLRLHDTTRHAPFLLIFLFLISCLLFLSYSKASSLLLFYLSWIFLFHLIVSYLDVNTLVVVVTHFSVLFPSCLLSHTKASYHIGSTYYIAYARTRSFPFPYLSCLRPFLSFCRS